MMRKPNARKKDMIDRVICEPLVIVWNCRWTGSGKNLSTRTINPKSA